MRLRNEIFMTDDEVVSYIKKSKAKAVLKNVLFHSFLSIYHIISTCPKVLAGSINPLLRTPLNREIHSPRATGINRRLCASTGSRICRKRAGSTVQQSVTTGSEDRARDTASARESTRRDAAVALGGLEREAASRGGGGDGGAGSGRVPCAGGDEAAVLAATADDVQVAGAGEGGAWGGSRVRTAAGGCGGRAAATATAAALGVVLDTGAGAVGGSQGVDGDELARLDTSLDVVEVPDFVENAGGTAEVGSLAVGGLQRGLDLGKGVGSSGSDAGVGEPGVGWKALEEVDDLLEEVGDFFGGLVVGIAVWVESCGWRLIRVFSGSRWKWPLTRNTGAMLGPLVLPEGLCGTRVALPVRIHVADKILLASRIENIGNVGVRAAGVTARLIRAIAVVWPETVDGPRVRRSNNRVGVPELSLEKSTSGSVEAAKIGDGGGVLAGSLRVCARGGCSTREHSVDGALQTSSHNSLGGGQAGEGEAGNVSWGRHHDVVVG